MSAVNVPDKLTGKLMVNERFFRKKTKQKTNEKFS